MLFNSFQFALFFALIYALYLVLPHRWQNRLLLAASYAFYGTWDWRFLSLILFSTAVNFGAGLAIAGTSEKARRKNIVSATVVVNLAILGVFKYFNFFADNLQSLLSLAGLQADLRFLDIILPVGISFYTFQSMSYTLDVNRKEVEPTRRFLDFALYVAFFPQLVAGPIERARHFLPQVLKPRKLTLEHFYEGAFLFFWGLFLKSFVADSLSRAVDPVYASAPPYQGAEVLIATYAFTFQIFCDFAGYSSMARGLGKMMGFDIMLNFNLPFFVTNIQDYWNRWHISLSSWLRDYLYVPLVGGMRGLKGNMRIYVALMISMTLIGFWHGAAWTYVVFGVYYGLLLVCYVRIRLRKRKLIQPRSRLGNSIWTAARMAFVFHLIVIGMLLFRSTDVSQSGHMLWALATNFGDPADVMGAVKFTIFCTWLLVLVQIWQYRSKNLMCIYHSPVVVRAGFYVVAFFLLLMYGVTDGGEFIYFQF